MTLKQKLLKSQPNLIMAIILVTAGLLGSYNIHSSSAATYTAPLGGADSCILSSNTLVVMGWAYDPNEPKTGSSQPYVNVTVGAKTQKVASSIAKYRDSAVNAYITKHVGASYPHPGVYGWSTSWPGYYKGGNYSISGLILNYGAGSTNPKMGIYTGNTVDGKASNGFPGSKIPDACLPARPGTTPAPTPAPAPAPAGGDSSDNDGYAGGDEPEADDSGGDEEQAGSSDNTADTGDAADDAEAKPSNAADAAATAGTITASLKVPAGNASKIRIEYGTDAAKLNQKTADEDADEDSMVINLDNLNALTTYQYHIVRTGDDGASVASGVASFKTKGFLVNLRFLDNKKKAVQGIAGHLNDKAKTKVLSDKTGAMNFSDLPGGTYTVAFNYKGKEYTKELDTGNAQVASGDNDTDTGQQPAVLSATIDVTQLGKKLGIGSAQPSHQKAGTVVSVMLVLALIVGFMFFVLRRRRHTNIGGIMPAPYNPATSSQDIIDRQMTQHFSTAPTVVSPRPQLPPAATMPVPAVSMPAPMPTIVVPSNTVTPSSALSGPNHAGESLRDMVIRSMHEEALRKQQNGAVDTPPQPPLTPPPTA